MHIRLNRCKNVTVEEIGLLDKTGEETLFVVRGRDTGCNSLRPPVVSDPVERVPVRTTTLDDYAQRAGISRVDFMKIDVEGAEQRLFAGAARSLRGAARPVMLCEVDDLRTRAWGSDSSAVRKFLEKLGYRWYGLDEEGRLVSLEERSGYNLVAVPGDTDKKLPFAPMGDRGLEPRTPSV